MEKEFSLTPVIGRDFVGRKELIEELVEELSNKRSHVGFCLYGRRRVGKTSAMMEVKHILRARKDVVVAYLSLFDIADLSQKTFADELVNSIIRVYNEKSLFPLAIRMKELLSSHIDILAKTLKNPKIEATVLEQIKIMIGFSNERSENYSEYLRHAFSFAETIAKATSTKCIVMLDEFPEILNIKNGLQMIKMFRTSYEMQKATALVISGSIRKTLDAVAMDDSSPFYRQLVPKHVLPFTVEETREFLNAYIQKKLNREEIMRLHELTGGLPFYLQFIGRSTRYHGDIASDVKDFVKHEGDIIFKNEFEKLSENEVKIVLAVGSKLISFGDIVNNSGVPGTSLGAYMPILEGKEIISKESRGVYKIADKLFGYWLESKYGN